MMKYNKSKHVKLKDLAKKQNITYESMYAKQARLGIKGIKVEDPETGRKIVVFTKKAAKEIMAKSPKNMTDKRVSIQDIAKTLKKSKATIDKAVVALKLKPVKMRRGGDSDNKSVSTLPKTSVTKIKAFLNKK